MYNFCVLIDDRIASNIEEIVSVSDRLKINNLETGDRLEGTDIADLKGEQVERIRDILIYNSKKIVLLNSSISVIELDYYKRLFRKAHMLGIDYINVPLEASDPDENYISCFSEVCKMGKAYEIGVLIENNSKAALHSDRSITGFLRQTGNMAELVFNPLEYVRIKKHPFLHEFYNSRLKGNVKFLRVNDGLFVNGEAVLPAQGNAEIKELASILLARSFKGYFSFAPYLKHVDEKDYAEIIMNFKKLLTQM